MLRELEAMSGGKTETVVRTECAKVLDLCIKYTKTTTTKRIQATGKLIVRKFNSYAGPGQAGISASQRIAGESFKQAGKDVAPRIADLSGGTFWVPVPGRYVPMFSVNEQTGRRRKIGTVPAEAFALNQMRLAELNREKALILDRLKKAKGLAARPWVDCARAIGIDGLLKNAGTAGQAIATNGKVYRNGTAREEHTRTVNMIELRVDSPVTLAKGQGQRVLEAAISTRVNAFGIELAKGVFEDVATRAARYPGVFIK